jgi:hypothetical protein
MSSHGPCEDSPDQDAAAVDAPQHGTHWRALDPGGRRVTDEDLLEQARCCPGVEHEGGVAFTHDHHPPVGATRSVLIASGSCPSSTRNRATFSTSGVGPHAKILGFCAGAKHVSASSERSILPRWPVQPVAGCGSAYGAHAGCDRAPPWRRAPGDRGHRPRFGVRSSRRSR